MRGYHFAIEQVNVYFNTCETIAKGIKKRALM